MSISKSELPTHIAMIMDGNGRWATQKYLPRLFGHRAGVETVRRMTRYASDVGVKYLTLYAFSTENWTRPKTEVKFLMGLFEHFITREEKFLHDNKVRVRFIGQREGLSNMLKNLMQGIEDKTAQNEGLTLILAVNYGARQEITQAVASLLQKGESLDQGEIEEALKAHLECSQFPEPDLLIRTAGEQRISNFLLWHIAYSELYFSDKLWPDFKEEDLQAALDYYAGRERRFGGLKAG